MMLSFCSIYKLAAMLRQSLRLAYGESPPFAQGRLVEIGRSTASHLLLPRGDLEDWWNMRALPLFAGGIRGFW